MTVDPAADNGTGAGNYSALRTRQARPASAIVSVVFPNYARSRHPWRLTDGDADSCPNDDSTGSGYEGVRVSVLSVSCSYRTNFT